MADQNQNPSTIGALFSGFQTPRRTIRNPVTGFEYEFSHELGAGAFGRVFSGVDRWNNDLAIKILHPAHDFNASLTAANKEVETLVQLRHPFVTYIYDGFYVGNEIYIITERCFMTVAQHLRLPNFDGRFWVKPMARCILQAVQFMHTKGVVHRDLHLGNVFTTFARDEMVPAQIGPATFKVGDFGIAQLADRIGTTAVNPAIMPPEHLDATYGPVGASADIYHCGLLLLQVLIGKQLQFSGDEVLAGKPRQTAEQFGGIFGPALARSLRRHVGDRTRSAFELWQDINKAARAH